MSEYQSKRNFIEFTEAAGVGLSFEQVQRVGLALDVAIAFGALELVDGNPSLQDQTLLAAGYAEKLARLKELAAAPPAAPFLPPLFGALEAELVAQLGAETVGQIKQTVTRHFDALVQSLLAIEPGAPPKVN